jgi:hypothetical protein
MAGRDAEKKQRIEIAIETRHLLIIYEPRDSVWGMCPQCGVDVRLVSSNQAGALVGESTRTIYRWIEEGLIHFKETPEGHLFVCLASLPQVEVVDESSD